MSRSFEGSWHVSRVVVSSRVRWWFTCPGVALGSTMRPSDPRAAGEPLDLLDHPVVTFGPGVRDAESEKGFDLGYHRSIVVASRVVSACPPRHKVVRKRVWLSAASCRL